MRLFRPVAVALIAVLAALPARADIFEEVVDTATQAYSILPPGQGRHPNLTEYLAAQGGTGHPAYVNDQLGMYESLIRGAPALTDLSLGKYFKFAFLEVGNADVLRSYDPRPGVTVIREKSHGVPHVYGGTRADVAFGAGYVAAEDRLFVMDIVRHLARGRLSELLGASRANMDMDRAQRAVADYTEDEIRALGARLEQVDPELGGLAMQDLRDYADGVNQFIAEALSTPQKLPAEYPLLQTVPKPWTVEDSLAQTTLIGALFSPGGAGQLANDAFLAELERVTGDPQEARAIFDDFRSAEDPEAPVTTDVAFPFNADLGPVDPEAVARADQPAAAAAAATIRWPETIDGPLGPIRLGIGTDALASNALLVSPDRSATQKALAVMGPQIGYWTPEVVHEVHLHGPGMYARGIAFPGMGPSIILGRGTSYAWSLTTAIGDHQDIRAVRLCNPSGGAAAADATSYMNDGSCLPMEQHVDAFVAKPSAGGIPAGPDVAVVRTSQRTRHGIVAARATVGGAPVAFVRQRSSYQRDADILLTYTSVMDPARTPDIRAEMRAFGMFPLSFNIFLIHSGNIGFVVAGRYPELADGVDPDLPFWGDSRWDWARILDFEEHAQEIDPPRGYIVNWNNKQAPGWRAADSYWAFGPVHRTKLLERALLAEDDGGIALSGVVRAMALAGTQDLRGTDLVPILLDAIGPPPEDVVRARALTLLREWSDAGAHRRDLDGDGKYEQRAAVALMDAWWPHLLDAVFKPALGTASGKVPLTQNNPPGPGGSAYASGWWGHLHKDLRATLGRPIAAPLSRHYCGADASACSLKLLGALDKALAELTAKYGAEPEKWDAQEARDQLRFTSVGVLAQRPMMWQNRPTFQHVLEFARG